MKQTRFRKRAAATISAAAVLGVTAMAALSGAADDYTIGITPTAEQEAALLGYDQILGETGIAQEDLLLGDAALFSVFLAQNFKANGSDCEGRLAAGGAISLDESLEAYSIGAHFSECGEEIAAVVVQDGPVGACVVSGDCAVVVGKEMADADIHLSGSPAVYRADLIDFDAQFAALREISTQLGALPANGTWSKGAWDSTVTFHAEGDAPLFVWNFTSEEWESLFAPDAYGSAAPMAFNFEVPDGSYVLINITGEAVTLTMPGAGTFFNGERIQGNDGAGSDRILFNLPEATTFHYAGYGTIFGSTLAPNADGSDDMTAGAHVSGQTIAKSYDGGIEFGYAAFSGTRAILAADDPQLTTTTETTTTTEQTTTEETTTEKTTTEMTTTTETTTTEQTTTEETTTEETTTEETTTEETTTEETTIEETTTEETTTEETTTEETTTEETTTEETTTEETTTTTYAAVSGEDDERTRTTTTTTETSTTVVTTSANGTTTTTTSRGVDTGERLPLGIACAAVLAIGAACAIRRRVA